MAARAWARRWAVLAFATAVTCAAVVVDAQPVRSAWWTYADADASYTAAGLNMLQGERGRFVDHPGLPVTEAAALAFAAEALFERGSLRHEARARFVDETMLDLDSARVVFRGLAVVAYLAGAVLGFLLVARLLGHWTWGFAAGLLWLAAPGLVAMSIQLRPDVPLAVLCVGFAFAVGRGLQTREPGAYALAGVLAGVAVMTKLHALGLVAPLLLAVAWRPPVGGWRELVERARARPRLVAALAVPFAVAALFLNAVRLPFTPTTEQVLALVGVLSAGAAAWLLGRFVPRVRALGLVGPAVVAGLLLPVALAIPDGLQSLVVVAKTVLGQGVQEGVDSFAVPFSELPSIVGPRVTVVYLLALVAAVVGVARREPEPVVWAFAAAVMVVLAFIRPPAVHYFAPGFVLAVPAVLWLLRRTPGTAAPVLVWPVVVLLAWPAFRDREAPTIETERFAALVEPSKRVVEARLQPNEVVLVPGNWPFADARWFDLARPYVDSPPEYPFTYLPATANARSYAELRGWRPRYFISPAVQSLQGAQTVDVDQYGRFVVQRIPDTDLAAELIQPAP